MSKSKFDYSLLKPIEGSQAQFDTSKLTPVEDESINELGSFPEPEGFFSKLPRNILIGLANLGHSTVNLPHDLIQGVENSLGEFGNTTNQLLPTELKEMLNKQNENRTKVSNAIPSQEEQNFAQMFGQQGEGTLMDKLLQKGLEYAPEIASGRALLKAGLRKYPITQKMAGKPLREAQTLARNRPLEPIDVTFDIFDEAPNFLNKTHETKQMLADAWKGDYDALFAMQSDLGREARALKKSPLAAERRAAPEAQALKQMILKDMKTKLREQGHHDIADLLGEGINSYRKYMQLKEKVKPIIKTLGIPTGLLSLMGLGYHKGKKLLED